MRPPATTLTPQELTIMKVVWALETATVRDVYEHLRSRRPVHERPIFPRLPHVSLLLEDLHHRQHGGIRDRAARAQVFVPITDGRGLERPHHLHDGEFLGREGRGRRSHLLNS